MSRYTAMSDAAHAEARSWKQRMERTGSLCAGTAEDEYDPIGGVFHHSFFRVMVFNPIEFERFVIGY